MLPEELRINPWQSPHISTSICCTSVSQHLLFLETNHKVHGCHSGPNHTVQNGGSSLCVRAPCPNFIPLLGRVPFPVGLSIGLPASCFSMPDRQPSHMYSVPRQPQGFLYEPPRFDKSPSQTHLATDHPFCCFHIFHHSSSVNCLSIFIWLWSLLALSPQQYVSCLRVFHTTSVSQTLRYFTPRLCLSFIGMQAVFCLAPHVAGHGSGVYFSILCLNALLNSFG